MKEKDDIGFGSVFVGFFIGVIFISIMWVITGNKGIQGNHACRFTTYYAQHKGRSK